MNTSDFIQTDRRLVILRLLQEASGYSLNSSVLRTGLEVKYGHLVSRDVVETELAWLGEQGLVRIERLDAPSKTITIATLTERGLDVQAGRATVPGVKRPSPV